MASQVAVTDPVVAMEVEQMQVMREWMISQMSDEELPYIEGVQDIHNKKEVLYVNIKRIGVNGTIIACKKDECTPWYSLNKLGLKLGYTKPADLFKEKGLLHGYEYKSLKNLLRGFTEEEIIDPEDIRANKHTSNMSSIYIPHKVASILMILAGQQEKFKAQSKIFMNLMEKIDNITTKVITKLNRIIAEYRHKDALQSIKAKDEEQQHQLQTMQQQLDAQQHQIKLLEERPLAGPTPDQLEQIDMLKQMAITASQKYQPRIHKTGWFYLVSTEKYVRNGIFKIGIASDFNIRLGQYHTHYPDIIEVFKIKVKNVDILEKYIKSLAKVNDLRFTPHKELEVLLKVDKDTEWLMLGLPEEAIKLVEHMANGHEITQTMIAEIIENKRRKILSDAGVENLPPAVAVEPESIGKRVVTRFIEEKIADNNIKEYPKTSAFLNEWKPVLKYFKKDSEYPQIPNDTDDILKLFEDDERVVIEIRKKGNTKAIKLSRSES